MSLPLNYTIAQLLAHSFDGAEWEFQKLTLSERLIVGDQAQLDEIRKFVITEHFRMEDPNYKENSMNFGQALEQLKLGAAVARTGWNGKGLWITLQVPDKNSLMTLPYLYINYPANAENTPGARVPWLASQTDILAEDWVLVD